MQTASGCASPSRQVPNGRETREQDREWTSNPCRSSPAATMPCRSPRARSPRAPPGPSEQVHRAPGAVGAAGVVHTHADGGALGVQRVEQRHPLPAVRGVEVPVGSPARSTAGEPAMARATATHRCRPPRFATTPAIAEKCPIRKGTGKPVYREPVGASMDNFSCPVDAAAFFLRRDRACPDYLPAAVALLRQQCLAIWCNAVERNRNYSYDTRPPTGRHPDPTTVVPRHRSTLPRMKNGRRTYVTFRRPFTRGERGDLNPRPPGPQPGGGCNRPSPPVTELL